MDSTAQPKETQMAKGVREFFKATSKKSCQEIGHILVASILEADHNNWEGFSSRDKTSIGRFLADAALCLESYGPVKDLSIFTGSRYLTTDRPFPTKE